MPVQEENQLTGLRKASMLLLALGTSASAQVLKHLSEQEIEKLSAEIVRMRKVDPEMTQAVLDEFERTATTAPSVAGRDFAVQVLDQVLGPEKTKHLLYRAVRTGGNRPFDFLWEADESLVAQLLREEHPQTAALVLINLPPEKAAPILSELPKEAQAQIARAICTMGEVDSDAVKAVEEILESEMLVLGAQAMVASGPKTLVDILNNSARSTERAVLDALRKGDPAIGKQVRGMMFIFEDLNKLEDRSIQLLLREVDQDDLRLALKGADDQIQSLVFRNMSERAADTLREDLELAGSVKQRDTEAAQQRIVSVVRRLLSTGEISLADGEERAA